MHCFRDVYIDLYESHLFSNLVMMAHKIIPRETLTGLRVNKGQGSGEGGGSEARGGGDYNEVLLKDADEDRNGGAREIKTVVLPLTFADRYRGTGHG